MHVPKYLNRIRYCTVYSLLKTLIKQQIRDRKHVLGYTFKSGD